MMGAETSRAEEVFYESLCGYCHVMDLDGPATFLEVFPEFHLARAKCESPIEEILCGCLVIARNLCRRIGRSFDFDQQVHVGPHRVDFLCTVDGKHFAVECDGHDFHEKTKDQAARDRARDRLLAINGVPTLRFTGSEIYSRPSQCMNDIQSFTNTISPYIRKKKNKKARKAT